MTISSFSGQRIGFFLIDEFSALAFSGAVESLHFANLTCGRVVYEWCVFTLDGRGAKASNGVVIPSDGPIATADSLSDMDMILVCAGTDSTGIFDKRGHAVLRRFARRGVVVGGLGTGSHMLAGAGVLDGYRCSVYWEDCDSFASTYPKVIISRNLFDLDRRRVTCCGGLAVIDMMLHLIRTQHGVAIASEVSRRCALLRIRETNDCQRPPVRLRVPTHHPKLVAAVEIMEQQLDSRSEISKIASKVGLSRRQLERLFKAFFSTSPTRYSLKLRLSRAQNLLRKSSMSVLEIAIATGFDSASNFAKCYRDEFGASPTEGKRAYFGSLQREGF